MSPGGVTSAPRERQVFDKQIADALGGTERTIKTHRHKVMAKMQVRSLAELVSLAERVRVGVLRDPSSPDRRPTNSLEGILTFNLVVSNLLFNVV